MEFNSEFDTGTHPDNLRDDARDAARKVAEAIEALQDALFEAYHLNAHLADAQGEGFIDGSDGIETLKVLQDLEGYDGDAPEGSCDMELVREKAEVLRGLTKADKPLFGDVGTLKSPTMLAIAKREDTNSMDEQDEDLALECKFCLQNCEQTPRFHQDEPVCNECWDDRLDITN